MSQEQVQRQKSKARAEETHIEESNTDVTNAELAEKTDETLASIDDVLEENAEEFVFNYVQQGGE